MRAEQAGLGATKLAILRETALSGSTWSKLLKSTGVSEKVLSGHLRDLRELALLSRSDSGYVVTNKGREVLRELTFVEDLRKQKLVRKLLVRQQVASLTDPITLESLKVKLSGHEPLSRSRYQALAFVEAVDVTSDRELDSDISIKVYDNALKMAAAALGTEKTATLTVTIDLDRGFALAEKRLEDEIKSQRDETKRKKLEAILQHFKERRDANVEETRKRFLSA